MSRPDFRRDYKIINFGSVLQIMMTDSKCILLVFLVVMTVCTDGTVIRPRKYIGEVKHGVKIGNDGRRKRAVEDHTETFDIQIFYDDSINELSTDIQDRIQQTIIPKIKDFLASTLMVRPLPGPILLDRDCVGGTFFPSASATAVQCSASCEPTTMCGQAEVLPDHLKRCVECDSQLNCITTGSDGPGVDTNFVLYVSSKTAGSCPTSSVSSSTSPSAVAFASSCQMESEYDRPIAGNINFCPTAFNGNSDDDFIFDVTKHELLHALAFASGLYPFWRDENGSPRTERDEFNDPPVENGAFTWSNNTIREVEYDNWEVISGLVNHKVYLLVTPAVVAEASDHFGCPGLEGVELENQGGTGTQLSHWEKRILGNEIMTGIVDSNPIVSRLSFALLEDSGWYAANYSYAEPLLYGRDAGCTFAERSCLSYMRQQRDSDESIYPLCDVSDNSDLMCSIDRQFLAKCSLGSFSGQLPIEYQYFDNLVMGGQELADYCPTFTSNFELGSSVSDENTGTDCTDSQNQPATQDDLRGETYGPNSGCFDHASRWTRSGVMSNPFGSGCYEYSVDCDTGALTVDVKGTSYTCYMPGDMVDIDGGVYSGSIMCPEIDPIFCEDFNGTFIVPSTSPPSTDNTDTPDSVSNVGPSFTAMTIGGLSLAIIWSILHDYFRIMI